MMKKSSDIPITNWGTLDRKLFWDTYAQQIEIHLTRSFYDYKETYDTSRYFSEKELELHGDSIEAYIAFVRKRFTEEKLEPKKIVDQTLALFTKVDFWLSQKVGAKRHRDWKNCSDIFYHDVEERIAAPSDEGVDMRREICTDLAWTLKMLREKTCSQVVKHWLETTKTARDYLSDNDVIEKTRFSLVERTCFEPDKKSLPRYRALAYMRFLGLFAEEWNTYELVLYAYFTPCDNKEPYYNRDHEALSMKRNDFSKMLRTSFWSFTLASLEQIEKWKRQDKKERVFAAFFIRSLPRPTSVLEAAGDRGRDNNPCIDAIKSTINQLKNIKG